MTQAPSIKEALDEALEDLQHFSDTQLDLNPKMQKVVATVVAALATLQPSGERREAIARILEPQAWAALGIGDTLAYKNRRTSSLRKADRILASGLVQDEAGIRADEREKCALVVERWSLPTIQTPSMWLVDKAGIALAIRSARDGGE